MPFPLELKLTMKSVTNNFDKQSERKTEKKKSKQAFAKLESGYEKK